MYDYIDIHSHLNFPDYEKDFDAVIQRLKDTNTATITVGTDLESSKRAVTLAEKYDMLYACIGLHPADNTEEAFDEKEFEKLVSHPKVVAIGECGLDYGNGKTPEPSEAEKARQCADFEKQIDFAVRYDKPLMMHVRGAYDDALKLLSEKQEKYGDKLRGDFHFYSGGYKRIERILELKNFTCSFTGVVTYTHDYDKPLLKLPLDKIMSETDAPYVLPEPYRSEDKSFGKNFRLNEPSYVQEVVKKIAEIRGEDFETVKKAVRDNAVRYFGL